jgi:hypothetical protein
MGMTLTTLASIPFSSLFQSIFFIVIHLEVVVDSLTFSESHKGGFCVGIAPLSTFQILWLFLEDSRLETKRSERRLGILDRAPWEGDVNIEIGHFAHPISFKWFPSQSRRFEKLGNNLPLRHWLDGDGYSSNRRRCNSKSVIELTETWSNESTHNKADMRFWRCRKIVWIPVLSFCLFWVNFEIGPWQCHWKAFDQVTPILLSIAPDLSFYGVTLSSQSGSTVCRKGDR